VFGRRQILNTCADNGVRGWGVDGADSYGVVRRALQNLFIVPHVAVFQCALTHALKMPKSHMRQFPPLNADVSLVGESYGKKYMGVHSSHLHRAGGQAACWKYAKVGHSRLT
jgi:hypothetical protein